MIRFAPLHCRRFLPLVCGAALLALVGCQNGGNPFFANNAGAANPALAQQQQQQLAQVQEWQRRANELDLNNRDLNQSLARSQQQLQTLQQELGATRRQLADISQQLQTALAAKDEAERNAQTMLASTQRRGGATISANNSFRQSLTAIQVPGVEVRQDGDVVRIELPADQLFQRGSAMFNQQSMTLIDQVAAAISQNYPRQRIGIEGHTDDSPVDGQQWRTPHQLSAAQATVVLEILTQRHRFLPQQLFVVGHGASYPMVSNGTPAGKARNRRIELVIYPVTYDAR